MDNKKNWLKSSISPEQVSNTVRGFVLAMTGVLIFFGQALGLPFSDTGVAMFAQQLSMAAGSLWFLYGLAMKGVMAIGKEKQYNKNY